MTTDVPRRDLIWDARGRRSPGAGKDAGRPDAPGQDESGRPAQDVALPSDDELSASQMAAMQSLDDARRAGHVTEDDFRTIEVVIRRGHVAGARKRITEARRRHRATP